MSAQPTQQYICTYIHIYIHPQQGGSCRKLYGAADMVDPDQEDGGEAYTFGKKSQIPRQPAVCNLKIATCRAPICFPLHLQAGSSMARRTWPTQIRRRAAGRRTHAGRRLRFGDNPNMQFRRLRMSHLVPPFCAAGGSSMARRTWWTQTRRTAGTRTHAGGLYRFTDRLN